MRLPSNGLRVRIAATPYEHCKRMPVTRRPRATGTERCAGRRPSPPALTSSGRIAGFAVAVSVAGPARNERNRRGGP